MNVLLYVNKIKDVNGVFEQKISKIFDKNNVSFDIISEKDLVDSKKYSADALFVYGGDGTILKLVPFVEKNRIPIVGINAGKIGFMNEFEESEIETAIDLLLKNKLIKDERLLIDVSFNGKKFLALNDAVVHRIISEDKFEGKINNLEISVDDVVMDKMSGDGVIVSTPTGSTAYSLAAGGPVLYPNLNALIVSPICAQFLRHRPVIVSADSVSRIKNIKGKAGLYVDGDFISNVNENDVVSIAKSDCKLIFLRRKDSNFYKKLVKKLFVVEE